jgi:ribosome-binding factor A
MSLRQERVRELLKREIGEAIRRELSISEVGVVSVNDVKLSKDLQSALVFVGVVGSPIQKKRAGEVLEKERIHIQNLVGKAVVLRYTPHLKFLLDDSIERGNRVLEIIDELEKTSHPDEGAPKNS